MARWRRMSRITPTVAAVIAGIFALLVILYVFAGGRSSGEDRDKKSGELVSQAAQAGSSARCSSQKTHDLLKTELFRQAADLRGDDASTFSQVARYAFLRVTAPRLEPKQQEGIVACAGSVTLDLPPGLSVAGGRRSLVSDMNYAVRGADTGNETVAIYNADAIITPLSTLSEANGRAARSDDGAAPDQATQAAPEPVAVPRPRPTANPVSPSPPRSISPSPAPAPVRAPARAAPVRVPAPARAAPPPREPSVPTPPAVEAPRATGSPSFSCRRARTRGEIAVCGDSGLASLDRQMAGQYNRAASAADSGKRLQLQRSRTRFLRFRDSCTSQACVAGAYRDRIREIDDIMNERWSPR